MLGLATFIVLGISGSESIEAQSVSAYHKLQEAAAQGDEWARSYLVQVDAFLNGQGKLPPPQEKQIGALDTVNGIRIRVRGHQPFYLKIYNHQEFSDLRGIEAYIATRRATLNQLTKQNPDRQIEVSLSPNEYTELSQVWQLKDIYGLDIDEMSVNLFLHGKWHSVMLVGDPKDPGERAIIDFTEPIEVVETSLRKLVPPRAFSEAIPDPSALKFKVGWIRAKMRASNALSLNSSSLAMAIVVDPITDLLDTYQGRAVEIRVVEVPHLLEKRNHLKVSAPAAPRPTPTPIREVN